MAITAVLGRCRADAAGREYCRPSSIQIFPLRLAWSAIQGTLLLASVLHRHCCSSPTAKPKLVRMGASGGSGANRSAWVLGYAADLPES